MKDLYSPRSLLIFLVEDGTEHDYDSHIMVWQLAVQQTTTAASAHAREPLRRLPPASASSSLRSSSLGLGPTPGSNLALDSQSEYGDGGVDSDQEEGEDGGDLNAGGGEFTDSLTVLTSRRPPLSSPSTTTVGNTAASHSGSSSVEVPYSSIETGTDPLCDAAWNKDVESMLNNPPPLDTFQSFMLSSEPSLSSWVVPPPPTASHFTEGPPPAADYSPFGFATRRQQGGKSRSPPEPGEDFTHHFSPGMLEK